MSTLGAETVRIRKQATLDDMGNPAFPGGAASYDGCAVYPRGTSTEAGGREMTVIDGYTVLIPDPGAVVTSEHEVEWARQPGTWRRVEGDPGLWVHLDGTPAGLQVNIKGARG